MGFTLGRVLLVCAVAGAFLGLIGPLDTLQAPLALRLGYWVIAAMGGGVIGWGVTVMLMRWLPLEGRPWLTIAAIALVMTAPATLFIWIWGELAFGGEAHMGGFLHLVGPVALISLAMTALNRLILDRPLPVQVAPSAPAVTRSAFLDRLPQRLRDAALLAVEAEDHYLRVHTDRGSDLILLRLSDALNELAALDGAQTHRSWWVARAAVRDVAKGDGRATLTLEGGLRVPVSRAHAANLRAAGWF